MVAIDPQEKLDIANKLLYIDGVVDVTVDKHIIKPIVKYESDTPPSREEFPENIEEQIDSIIKHTNFVWATNRGIDGEDFRTIEYTTIVKEWSPVISEILQ